MSKTLNTNKFTFLHSPSPCLRQAWGGLGRGQELEGTSQAVRKPLVPGFLQKKT